MSEHANPQINDHNMISALSHFSASIPMSSTSVLPSVGMRLLRPCIHLNGSMLTAMHLNRLVLDSVHLYDDATIQFLWDTRSNTPIRFHHCRLSSVRVTVRVTVTPSRRWRAHRSTFDMVPRQDSCRNYRRNANSDANSQAYLGTITEFSVG